jgi:hypothetical protein
MNRSILMGAASAVMLAACTNMPIDGAGGGRDPIAAATVLDEICATVQVRCIEILVQGGVITQVKDEEFVGPNHLILWKVKTVSPTNPPYTFLANGIDFKADSPTPPAHEFNCRPVAQNKMFVCSNRNTVAKTYRYNVKMKDGSGNAIPVFDPIIVNR